MFYNFRNKKNNYNIYISYNMPAKLNMVISNGNHMLPQIRALEVANAPKVSKAPTSLNAPFIARVHNVRPGCGSCGRK